MSSTNTPALLCVGSGITRRYRLNTLQALALPSEAHIQFRYSSRLIPEGLQQKLSRGELAGSTILLGHVDCTENGRQPTGRCFVVPYRQAHLVEATRLGSIFVLRLRLGALRTAPDLDAFQRTLPNNSPHWRLGAAGQPTLDAKGRPIFDGAWCQEVPGDLQATIATDSIDDWQKIVEQLHKREDFARQPYFYMVEGVRERAGTNRGVPLQPTEGQYAFKAGSEYELSVFHYDPDSDAHTGGKRTQWFALDASAPAFSMRSGSRVAIDSPYDLKSFHFGTQDSHRAENGSLFLHPDHGNSDSDSVPDLFLPAAIMGNSTRAIRNGLILGALLSASQLVTMFSRGSVDTWAVVAALALGGITGLFVSFGMRKPL